MNPEVPDNCPLHEQHAWQRGRALYGFLVASAIFTVLVYALLFSARQDSITNCEQRNAQFVEVNQRAALINELIELMEARNPHLREQSAKPVTLTDCNRTFSKPWPLG